MMRFRVFALGLLLVPCPGASSRSAHLASNRRRARSQASGADMPMAFPRSIWSSPMKPASRRVPYCSISTFASPRTRRGRRKPVSRNRSTMSNSTATQCSSMRATAGVTRQGLCKILGCTSASRCSGATGPNSSTKQKTGLRWRWCEATIDANIRSKARLLFLKP